MMPSDIPPLEKYPISTAMRNLENAHLAAVYAPLNPDTAGWIMEPRIWSALQSEWAVLYQYDWKFMPLTATQGLPVMIFPTMTGVTLYNSERGVSFNVDGTMPPGTLGIKQIPGQIDWLALIKTGARAVA